MKIDCSHCAGHSVLALTGRLDATEAPALEKALADALKEGKPAVIVDCAELQYAASMGLRCFIKVNKEAQERGVTLIFCALNKNLSDMFRLTGIADLLRIAADRAEAEQLIAP